MQAVVVILAIALAVAFFLLLVFLIKAALFGRWLVRNFKTSNVIVDGKKGKGKDLLFQYVINKRKKPYYSNVDYGGDCEKIGLKEISVDPNTYEDFIQGDVKEVARRFVEQKDVYISDGGVYLPSYADSVLHKHFRSMPLYYPLSRHLANHNIHVNVQNCSRVWKPLREQADFFVHVKGRLKLPFFILVHANTYDREQSAMECIEPMRGRWFNKYSRAEVDQYKALHGEIKSGWVIVRKRSIRYDTRAMEKIVYGEQPRIEQ